VLTASERAQLIDTYESGISALVEAFRDAPDEALHFKPEPGEWSNQEIVCHCADAEILGAVRVRMLTAEREAVLVAIDQDVWANTFNYESLSAESALALVRATRIHTAAILRLLPEAVWSNVGRHTETGPYSIEEWLSYWANHLHVHAEQIRHNVSLFESQA
jgi:hypothetical protein